MRASTSLETTYGRATIRWQRDENSVQIDAEVPAGTRATLHPPVAADPIMLTSGNHTFEFELAAANDQDDAHLQPVHR
jgi:alpha-L-rhamnosidase